MGSLRLVFVFALGVACEPRVYATPKQIDAWHLSCEQSIERGYRVRGSRNVGFTAPKPSGTPVIVYGADWCEPCHIAAAYLDRRGIPYVKLDVERDGAAKAAMHSTLSQANVVAGNVLPVLDIRGTVMAGFNPCVVDAAWAG